VLTEEEKRWIGKMPPAGLPTHIILEITIRLRREVMFISRQRQELMLRKIEIISIHHENVQKIRRDTLAAVQLDQNNEQRDVTRQNYRNMCVAENDDFALRLQEWQEAVDVLRLRGEECFADPGWNLVSERLRENRDLEQDDLETMDE